MSKALSGFQRSSKSDKGYELFTVYAWDYIELLKTYSKAADLARKNHVPCIIHVKEVTQPQGHTTSGSHERYKSKERLQWEKDNCCIKKMKEWIIENDICTLKELSEIEVSAERSAKESRDRSWRDYRSSINEDLDDALAVITRVAQNSPKNKNEIINIRKQ